MNVSRMGRRLATAGIASALAAGALVGASTTAANAVAANGTYTCTVLGNPVDFPMSVDVPILPPSANAGTAIPAGLLQATTTFGIPATVAGALGTYNVTGGTISDFGMLVGDTKAPAPLTFTSFTPGTDPGSLVTSALGINSPFSLPAAGTYDITLPKSFTFVPTTANGPLPISIPCTTATPAKLSSIRLDKNGSITDATAPAKIRKGTTAKVTSVVSSINDGTPAPTGKIVAKLGTKTVGTGTVKAGKAVMKVAKLPVGKDKLKIKYLGDSYTSPSGDTVVIKVVR